MPVVARKLVATCSRARIAERAGIAHSTDSGTDSIGSWGEGAGPGGVEAQSLHRSGEIQGCKHRLHLWGFISEASAAVTLA
jgi:hypothetical protein